MAYWGDIRLGDTIDIKFCTVTTTGAPTQLAGTPVVSAYVGNDTTQITAGITLSVDFDSVTGLNNVRVVASSGNGYATASNYALIITTGTVGGTSVVGYEVGSFSIENRSAVMPTVAARTLDVSAGGEAGLDWANIGSPTTAQNLSATNIDVDQVVASVSGAVGSVTATVNADVVAISGDSAAADNCEAAFDGNTYNVGGGAIVAASVTGAVGSVTGAVGSVTGNVGGNVAGSVGSVVGAVGSVTGNVGGNVAGSVGSVAAGGIAAASFAAGAIDNAAIAANAIAAAEIAAGAITSAKFAADAIDANALAADAVTEIAAGVFARAFSAAYGSLTFDEIVKVCVAALGAKLSGAATTTVTIRDLADTGDVIVATVDADGNRTAVTLTP